MNNQVEIKDVLMADIVVKENIQQRVRVDYECVKDYCEALKDGAAFPPVILFDDGKQLFLSDGVHRYLAYEDLKIQTIVAEIHKGTERDAIYYAVGANSNHGLRRTNQDKRKAVITLLRDMEWQKMSDNSIAEACRVSQPFVGKIRKEMPTYNDYKSDYKRIGSDGRATNVGNIGQKKNQQAQASESAPADNSSPEQPVPETTDQNVPDQTQTGPEAQQEPAVGSTVSDGDAKVKDAPVAENQSPEPSEKTVPNEQDNQQPEQVSDVGTDANLASEDIQDKGSTDERVQNVPTGTEEVQEPLQASANEETVPNVDLEPDVATPEVVSASENLHDIVLQEKILDLEKQLHDKDEELEKCRLRISELEDEVDTLKNENVYLKEVAKESESVS